MAFGSTHAEKRRNRSILVVGNTTRERDSVTLLLQRFAYEVIDACTAGEAIERISTTIPVLVITELVLPGMSGMDLFHLLRQTKRTASIPVVFMIPLTDAASERRCLDAGAAGCITKPVRAEELYRTVQAVIEPMQRCDIRIDTRLYVSVNNVPLDCDKGGCKIELSERGMYVLMAKPYPSNRRITIQVHIKDRVICAEGAVLYSHASGVVPHKESGMGLKFINIKPGDREFIRKFIRDEVMRDVRTSLAHETFDPCQ
jgi:CheY-like chemotaxis protein